MFVYKSPLSGKKGVLRFMEKTFPCALGRGGIVSVKREGDGGTPVGNWFFRKVFFRADRVNRFLTAVPLQAISKMDGWCDDPWDGNYNRYVRLPYSGRTETLWREDCLYDIMVVLSHNECPRVQEAGSAIFMHVAKEGYQPTEGCIALRRDHLQYILQYATRRTSVQVLRSP